MSMEAKFSVGIDLGTTNSVVAYCRLGETTGSGPRPVTLLSIPQLVAPAVVEGRYSLPSFLYLASPQEDRAVYNLPWSKERDFTLGEMARQQAADVPMRTIAAAKSWLCNTRVDRHQPILPWGAPQEVAKISPIEASRRYLEHIVAAWDSAFPESPLARQKVVVTVPASFDASSRELTREAALQAGLPTEFVLLEEPQAALYAWLADSGDSWRRHLKEGDALLVCDIGGGTTDFTLIRAVSEGGELGLKREAVGNHILVGGDNMDLTLAHLAKTYFEEKGVEVDAWQSVALWHACRAAKERLLSADGAQTHPVAVLGRGRKLIGGTISIDLYRQEVANRLLEGFFPACPLSARPARRHVSGFREIGLQFESDVAITKHLAQFLMQQGENTAIRPTHILFNGGVLKSNVLRERLLEVIGSWFGKEAPDILQGNQDLDYAVARGAAYYGAAKEGGGVRIRGGTARSYYIGVETAGPAIPGAPRPLQARCVVPFGMEEGSRIEVPGEEIGLVTGEAAQFRFFSSAVRKYDEPGDVLESWTEDELLETDSMETSLAASQETDFVPVRFESHITELGVFELWCVSTVSGERWKLEFSVRERENA